MIIKIDDLKSKEIIDFLEQHIAEMKSVSPPESKHALDLEGLRKPDVSFWSAWKENELVGCGALLKLNSTQCEIKSMRSKPSARGAGVASFVLQHIIDEAVKSGMNRVSLETGSMPFFNPAHKLYEKFGFIKCEPFADYKDDANSIFMTKYI